MNNPIVLATKNKLPNETTRVYTLVWAKMFRSPIIIHNVVSMPEYIIPNTMLGANGIGTTAVKYLGENQLLLQAEKVVKTLEKEMKKHWAFVYGETCKGLPTQSVIETTQEHNPQLTVIEVKSNHNYWEELFGTYATNVAEQATNPVCIMPEELDYKPIHTILYLMDYNVEDLDNLKYLQKFCRLSNAKLIIANFSEKTIDKDEVKKFKTRSTQIRAQLDYKNISFYQDFSLNPYENIQYIVNNSNIDMLAFQKLNKSFLQRLLDAKNTKSLILNTELPTLVF